MKIEGKAFAEAFALVDLVPEQSGVESSHFVRLAAKEGKLVLRMAGIVSAAATVKGEGEIKIFADRKVLRAFVGRIGDGTITIENADTGVQLKHQRSTLTLTQPEEITGYSSWKQGPGKEASFERGLIGMLSKYASKVESYISVVRLEKGWGTVAGDGIALAACLDPGVPISCPLPKMLLDLIPPSTEKIWVEEKGAALRNEMGWIYQPIPTSEKPFPLDKIKEVLNGSVKAKPYIKIKNDKLLDVVKHFQSYAWGGKSYGILCEAGKKSDTISFRLETPVVKTSIIVEADESNFPETRWQWPLEKVEDWAEFIAKQGECEVEAGRSEHFHFFRCKVNKKQHILAVVQQG
jgi:hypothetical protein